MGTCICFLSFSHAMIAIVTHVLSVMLSIMVWAFQNLSSDSFRISRERIGFRIELAVVDLCFEVIARHCSVGSFTGDVSYFGFCLTAAIFSLKVLDLLRNFSTFFIFWLFFILDLNFFLSCGYLLSRFTQLVQYLVN